MNSMAAGHVPDTVPRLAADGSLRARAADRIAGFDGLRALAFLGVFANHKLEIAQRDALGCVGVWTFFALSGFLITGILSRSREDVEAGRISRGSALKRFYLRRTARIFPIYYCLLVVAVVISSFVKTDDFWLHDRIAYFLYATNILVGLHGEWIGDFGHLWSLAVEEQYYLLFAPLVLLMPRRRTAFLCLAMVLGGLATALILHAANAAPLAIYVNSLVNFGMLGFGGLVGLASRRGAPAWLASGPAQAVVAGCLIAAPLAFGAAHDAWMAWGPFVILLSGLLLFQIYNGQGSAVVRLLEWGPLRLTGRVSYAAYLFHPFLHFATLQKVLGAAGYGLDAPRPVQILAEFAATMLLSAITWRLIEAPVIDWAARVSKRLFLAPKPTALAPDAAPAA